MSPTSSSGTGRPCACVRRGARTRTTSSSSSRRSRSGASTFASTAFRGLGRSWSSSSSTRTGRSEGPCSGRSPRTGTRSSSPSPTTSGSEIRRSRRRRSPSPTRISGVGSARGSSSSSPSARGREGIDRFVAEVLSDNRNMLGVFEALGFELTRELAGGEIEIQFPIARTERYEERLDERDHVAVTASLRPFFEPRSVAVVGASRRRGADRWRALPQHPRGRLRGHRVPREPGRHLRGGRAGVPHDRRDPRRRRPRGDQRARGRRARGSRGRPAKPACAPLVVISAGFAEVGTEGVERQEELLALVRAHGARLIGPNCLGIAVAGPSLNATFASRAAPAGQHRLLVPERRPRPRAARGRGDAWPRPLGIRLDREQGGRLDERPARVVGGRQRDRGRPALRGVVRQPTALRPPGAPGRAAEAHPRAEERHVRERAARRRARTPRRSQGRRRPRRALPPGRCDPRGRRSRS